MTNRAIVAEAFGVDSQNCTQGRAESRHGKAAAKCKKERATQ
ncbi:MAG: hypothetical protein WDA68_07880 [Phycisphaerae bacterium]